MTAWTTNPQWDTPTKTELCGRVSDRFIPCAHERPCPIHDHKPYGPQKAGASRSLSLSGAPAAVPMLPLFDSVETAA